jgi:hypothetical protein
MIEKENSKLVTSECRPPTSLRSYAVLPDEIMKKCHILEIKKVPTRVIHVPLPD